MNWPTFFTAFAGGLTALLIGGPVIVWVIVRYLEGFADELRDDLLLGRPSFTPSASRPASSGVSPVPPSSRPFGRSCPGESPSWPPYAYPGHQAPRIAPTDDLRRYDHRRYR